MALKLTKAGHKAPHLHSAYWQVKDSPIFLEKNEIGEAPAWNFLHGPQDMKCLEGPWTAWADRNHELFFDMEFPTRRAALDYLEALFAIDPPPSR
jgi:hypothetical protein